MLGSAVARTLLASSATRGLNNKLFFFPVGSLGFGNGSSVSTVKKSVDNYKLAEKYMYIQQYMILFIKVLVQQHVHIKKSEVNGHRLLWYI